MLTDVTKGDKGQIEGLPELTRAQSLSLNLAVG